MGSGIPTCSRCPRSSPSACRLWRPGCWWRSRGYVPNVLSLCDLLFRCYICPGEAAVNQEGGGRYVGGLVRGQEEGAVGDLGGLGEAAHRQVDEPALGLLGVFGEELLQERCVHRTGAEGVYAHTPTGELDAELAAHGEHATFGCCVGDLGSRSPHHGDEGGGVDDRPAAAFQEVRDAVLAAKVDALQVDVLYPIPGLHLGLQDRVVVRRGDAGVVEEHVYAAEALRGLPIHQLHVVRVCYVSMDVEAIDFRSYLFARLVGEVGDADARPFFGEAAGCLAPDTARGAGYDGHLPFETSRHPSPPPRCSPTARMSAPLPQWRYRRSSPRCSSRGRAGRARARRQIASSRRRASPRAPRYWS